MSLILILSIFYGFIIYKEEQKWQKYKWSNLINEKS